MQPSISLPKLDTATECYIISLLIKTYDASIPFSGALKRENGFSDGTLLVFVRDSQNFTRRQRQFNASGCGRGPLVGGRGKSDASDQLGGCFTCHTRFSWPCAGRSPTGRRHRQRGAKARGGHGRRGNGRHPDGGGGASSRKQTPSGPQASLAHALVYFVQTRADARHPNAYRTAYELNPMHYKRISLKKEGNSRNIVAIYSASTAPQTTSCMLRP